jgi:hypothetical protein
MQIYKYLGSLHHGNRTRIRFLTPVFEKEGKYYVQKLIDDVIIDFTEISEPDITLLIEPSNEFFCEIGNRGYYSFNLDEKDEIEGTYSEIEPKLLDLLNPEYAKHKINEPAKLVIANFLNLYQIQIELIELVNIELKKYGASNQISIETPFNHKKKIYFTKLAHSIFEYVKGVRLKNVKFRVCDAAYIQGNKVYFQRFESEIGNVLNRETALNSDLDFIICELANVCFDLESLSELISSGEDRVFEYLLLTSNFRPKNGMLEGIYLGIIGESSLRHELPLIEV